MNKNEIIFLILLIIAYITCAVIFNIPQAMNVIVIAILLVLILISVAFKFKRENEKISHIFDIITKILAVILILSIILGALLKQAFFMNYNILVVLIFISIIISWFFKKEED